MSKNYFQMTSIGFTLDVMFERINCKTCSFRSVIYDDIKFYNPILCERAPFLNRCQGHSLPRQ